MLDSRTILVAVLAALSNAAPSPFRHVLHEKRTAPLASWIRGARIEEGAILPMRIALTQTNLDKSIGYDALMEVSDPGSPNYGKYWDADDVHAIFAPASETAEIVKQWLSSAGIHESRVKHTVNKGWLAFDASVEEAERMLLTQFFEHEHRFSPAVKIGCDEYHIPEHIVPHIDYITPGIKLSNRVVKRSIKVAKTTTERNSRKSPIWGFGRGRHERPSSTTAAGLPLDLRDCAATMTPTCHRALYQIPDPVKVSTGNSLGVFEQGCYFARVFSCWNSSNDLVLYFGGASKGELARNFLMIAKSDLDDFNANFAPWVPNGTYPIPALIDGAAYTLPIDNPLVGLGEAQVDINIATALIYPQTVTLYQTDDQIYEPLEDSTKGIQYNTFLDAIDGSYCTSTAYGETGDDPEIDAVYPDTADGGYKGTRQCGTFIPAKVISLSYVEAEVDAPINYSKRQCNEFLKLGLQGHSILFCSGDYGVNNHPFDAGCLGPEKAIFSPNYPTNCPYITSVGATMLVDEEYNSPINELGNTTTVFDPEHAMDLRDNTLPPEWYFTSGGGFSNYYPQPRYQAKAVDEYLRTARLPFQGYAEMGVNMNTTKGVYNQIGRAYPDISANGVNVPIYAGGPESLRPRYGTSLSAPLVAAVITLLNEERIAVGKGPVGFINPLLYAHPEILNDITLGGNYGCGREAFQAVKGWDPVTGLGTPNFPRMKKLLLSLP